MPRLIALAVLAFALLQAAPARAACDDSSNQAELTMCADQQLAASDAQLNDLYGQIRQRLANDADVAGHLVAAQKAWIAFRDAECGFVASGVEGGSIQPMIIMDCRDRLTRLRVDDLKRYLSCEEGDTECPVPAP